MDSQFAADYGLPVPVVIETDEQGKERLVNSAQVCILKHNII